MPQAPWAHRVTPLGCLYEDRLTVFNQPVILEPPPSIIDAGNQQLKTIRVETRREETSGTTTTRP